jgi:large conductance mechanosensitive channel
MKSFIAEFKEFAIKGDVMDLAVGVIIGSAFGKIVTSLVSDVIMPPIGFLVGGVNFRDLAWTMKNATGDQPALKLNYGNFLQTLFDFTIVALVIFVMVRIINRLKRVQEVEQKVEEIIEIAETVSKEEILLTEIRDILKTK